MIVIEIADDEQKDRELLKSYFEQLQKEINEEFKIRVYESGDALLADQDVEADIICLDIEMKGKNGLKTAAEIRKRDANVIIIFITNMAQLAIKGYEVQALDFVVKPINYSAFALKMKNAMNIILNRKSRNIVLNTVNGMQKISTNDLFYAEVNGHYLYYHTRQGVFKQKTSMKDLEEKLSGLSFKRCNNCYLINLKYVDCVNKDDLQINGEWLKISRPRKKEFLQSLANYMGGISI